MLIPAHSARLRSAEQWQRDAVAKVRERDPNWQPTPQATARDSIDGLVAAREAIAREAQSRYQELIRDSVPWANPSWGVRRLENELRERGFEFITPTRAPGKLYENPKTREQVRIMEQPESRPSRTESHQKRLNDYYRKVNT